MINGGRAVQALQPLVFLGERVLVLTREAAADAALVMPSGVTHPLRTLCAVRTWIEHQSVVNRAALAQALEAEVRKQRLADSNDALDYVVGHLVPEFSGSFWGAAGLQPFVPRPASATAFPSTEILAQAPLPPWVAPAIWLLGRVWLLRRVSSEKSDLATCTPLPEGTTTSLPLQSRATETQPLPGQAPAAARRRMEVRADGEVFVCSGEFVLFRNLDEAWGRQVGEYLECRVKARTLTDDITTEPALVEARRTFHQLGYWQGGDFLFIAGNPPWLAYVIPAHYSHTLGRESRRDLALGVPWSNPPLVSRLGAFAFEEGCGWRPFAPPHGICVGAEAPTAANAAKLEPGLRVLSYLGWAAGRVAANGHFHEYELRSE